MVRLQPDVYVEKRSGKPLQEQPREQSIEVAFVSKNDFRSG